MTNVEETIEQMRIENDKYIEQNCPLIYLLKLISEPEEDNEMSKKVKEIREITGEMVVYNEYGDIITL